MIERPLYLDKIMPFVDTPFVKILTGVRRCGKSTILKIIIKKIKEEKNLELSIFTDANINKIYMDNIKIIYKSRTRYLMKGAVL